MIKHLLILLLLTVGGEIVKEKRLGTVHLKPNKEIKLHQRRSVEKLMETVVDSTGVITFLERSKRPARLLPYHLL